MGYIKYISSFYFHNIPEVRNALVSLGINWYERKEPLWPFLVIREYEGNTIYMGSSEYHAKVNGLSLYLGHTQDIAELFSAQSKEKPQQWLYKPKAESIWKLHGCPMTQEEADAEFKPFGENWEYKKLI